VVILVQVWACLILAQLVQAVRLEIACRAQVEPFEVSLPGHGEVRAPALGHGPGSDCHVCATRTPTGPHSSVQPHPRAGARSGRRADPAKALEPGADPSSQVSA